MSLVTRRSGIAAAGVVMVAVGAFVLHYCWRRPAAGARRAADQHGCRGRRRACCGDVWSAAAAAPARRGRRAARRVGRGCRSVRSSAGHHQRPGCRSYAPSPAATIAATDAAAMRRRGRRRRAAWLLVGRLSTVAHPKQTSAQQNAIWREGRKVTSCAQHATARGAYARDDRTLRSRASRRSVATSCCVPCWKGHPASTLF